MTAPARHRPNVVFWLLGMALVIGGLGLMALGVISAIQGIPSAEPQFSDLGVGPDARGDLEPMVNGFAVFIVGCTVMTVGRYLWRGARRRGWRDRLGRVLIIVGYIVVGAGFYVLTRFVLEAMGERDIDESRRILIGGMVVCAVLAMPGGLLALLGIRLAKEKVLMTAEATFDPPERPPGR